eukprot:2586721-Pleurochrysis_carterae.AAC.2
MPRRTQGTRATEASPMGHAQSFLSCHVLDKIGADGGNASQRQIGMDPVTLMNGLCATPALPMSTASTHFSPGGASQAVVAWGKYDEEEPEPEAEPETKAD